MKKLDLTGHIFGRLTVISAAPNRGKLTYWNCVCSCGNFSTVQTTNLTSGKVQSCGCLMRDIARERHLTHGLSDTRLFHIWASMRGRCTNKNDQAFKYYGGRGITVCDEWQKFETFREWALANGYRDDLTIDRINSDGNYCPNNCRWVIQSIQSKNRRCVVTYKGKTIPDFCAEHNLKKSTVYSRLKSGWSIEKAIFTPVRSR